jgi:hypothetical protein
MIVDCLIENRTHRIVSFGKAWIQGGTRVSWFSPSRRFDKVVMLLLLKTAGSSASLFLKRYRSVKFPNPSSAFDGICVIAQF